MQSETTESDRILEAVASFVPFEAIELFQLDCVSGGQAAIPQVGVQGNVGLQVSNSQSSATTTTNDGTMNAYNNQVWWNRVVGAGLAAFGNGPGNWADRAGAYWRGDVTAERQHQVDYRNAGRGAQ